MFEKTKEFAIQKKNKDALEIFKKITGIESIFGKGTCLYMLDLFGSIVGLVFFILIVIWSILWIIVPFMIYSIMDSVRKIHNMTVDIKKLIVDVEKDVYTTKESIIDIGKDVYTIKESITHTNKRRNKRKYYRK